MWGMGDASAALVGIPYGKHKIKTGFAVKSWEGTLAMFSAAFISGIFVLRFFGGLNMGRAVAAALLGATVGAVTELFSPSEWDTVTVPVVIMVALMIATI
jgi:phytol kinase